MPVNKFYFVLYMLIDMAFHVRTVKAILSSACHLPNPFTNEYQSEIISSHFSSGQSGGGCGLLSVMCNQI